MYKFTSVFNTNKQFLSKAFKYSTKFTMNMENGDGSQALKYIICGLVLLFVLLNKKQKPDMRGTL